ncbi:hypothetical protein LR48_Vigan08g047700 [Vigna angularis]|uniref:Uncharacterized protein n=1 Tax=Phaseolus angularis TaxID=3914 RepID=A0A0L9V3K7_PHAAN|nr:hypothetical protein LR48_Vigan08g047700 [Vigna angularis]
MTGQGSERPDKGKGVARPKKRQRQGPKYVLRVPAKLPTIVARSTSSVGPPPTPTIQPPTPVIEPTPSSTIHPYPTPTVHPSSTLATHPSTTPTVDPLPPPVIITPTPPPVVITPTPLPDPTFIPSSSCISPSETVTPSTDPDSSGNGEGLDPPLHDRPWIEPYAQALGRAVHVDEVFAQNHVRKGTNQFVDERSRKTHEEFSTRLSQVRSEHESTPTSDDASNAEDDIHRTQCWVDIVGGKKKGQVYGTRQLAANYTTSRGGTLKHRPSSSTTTANEVVLRLTQELEQRDQEITDLIVEFTNFKALVMRVLLETSQDEFNIPLTQPRPPRHPLSLNNPHQSNPHQSSRHQSNPHQSSHL